MVRESESFEFSCSFLLEERCLKTLFCRFCTNGGGFAVTSVKGGVVTWQRDCETVVRTMLDDVLNYMTLETARRFEFCEMSSWTTFKGKGIKKFSFLSEEKQIQFP